MEETEQDDEEEHPPKRRHQDKAKSEGSPSNRVMLEGDGDSDSSLSSVKDPMEVVPLNQGFGFRPRKTNFGQNPAISFKTGKCVYQTKTIEFCGNLVK